MDKAKYITGIFFLSAFLMFGCAGSRAPLEEIRETLAGVPTFSVILDDMKEEGNFFKTYYHKYAIVTEEDRSTTDWLEVQKKTFQKYMPFLGMTIWVKQDGKGGRTIGPPGYEYVGNPWYGRWQTDASGRSFWVFYGQYRLFSDLLGPGPIYRNHYSTYTTYRSQQRPYYGPNREYGTNGSLTRRQKPNFYSRRMSRMQSQRTSFASKVNKRIGRTKTSVRGRSTRVGK